MNEAVVLLTGFPSNELACRVLARLLEAERATQVVCLVLERFADAAAAWLAARTPEQRERVRVLHGDVASLDLGLSGAEYNQLAAQVTCIHHCAAVTYTGAASALAERVNVGGTGEVLELGRAARRLERIVHWSTLQATAGDGRVVNEQHLVEPHSTRLLHTRYRAEKVLARARTELPITVLRPALLVGDTVDGTLRRVEGLHLLVAGVVNLPRELPLPLLGVSDAPVYAVPIDYAVDAGLTIARARDTVGRTFHIIEPSPPTLHEVLRTLSELADRPAPKGTLPHALARAMLRLPGLSQLAHAQRALLEEVGRGLRYDDRDARSVLDRAGLVCPSLLAHLPRLVAGVSAQRTLKTARLPAASAP